MNSLYFQERKANDVQNGIKHVFSYAPYLCSIHLKAMSTNQDNIDDPRLNTSAQQTRDPGTGQPRPLQMSENERLRQETNAAQINWAAAKQVFLRDRDYFRDVVQRADYWLNPQVQEQSQERVTHERKVLDDITRLWDIVNTALSGDMQKLCRFAAEWRLTLQIMEGTEMLPTRPVGYIELQTALIGILRDFGISLGGREDFVFFKMLNTPRATMG